MPANRRDRGASLQKSKAVKENRPVNLDLTTIQLPITAVTSILHRVSGVAIFVGLALLMYLLDASLRSEQSFNEIKSLLDDSFLLKAALWLVVSAFIYHAAAGIKHLIMDLGFGETLEGGKRGATVVIAVSAILIVLAGVWIW